ncbi:NXPE family member 3-like [Betta splendens]|uniref:NXPE family member 3-like n=1 Tax=Betta splendens TaxID=158456 RepID=A0A6P7NDM9_BETSP|nr:NXPE family member 3-like [Betta splendens]
MASICKNRQGTICYFIIICLSMITLVYMLCSLDVWQAQNRVDYITTTSRDNTKSKMTQSFCSFQPLSPEDALETQLLLDSTAWPKDPPLSVPIPVDQISSAAKSTFTILQGTGRGQWHVGDQLKVLITMYDLRGRPKKFGGDFIIARLHSPALGAGVAGQVVDHLNGSYSAVFYLLWEGTVQVEVTLVHSSEAIAVLRNLTNKQPDRIYFQSYFRSGSVSEKTMCNVCLNMTQPVCNYTDLHTGDPWFCYKPKKLSCHARISHSKGGFKENLKDWERKLFDKSVIKVAIQASTYPNVTVLPSKSGQAEMQKSSVNSEPSGYYYQGVWRALGSTVLQFNTSSAMSECLKEKVVHLYGDSTIRQWFEHLIAAMPDLKDFNLHNSKQNGPFMAFDFANNIMVTYRCHGPPLRFMDVPTGDLRYIANELDGLKGGAGTTVVLSIWSHFSTFPIELYIQRLRGIRKAVLRLLDRSPGTLVIVRTANLKALTLFETLTNSDWYSLQRDKVLRAMFRGLKVHLVDAWEMSLAHHLPHSLHPQPPIIKNMINVLLSYICPPKGG